MFSQSALPSNYYNPNKIKWIKNYTQFNSEKSWYKKCFANNSDDSRMNDMLYSVKLEASIMNIGKSIMNLCFLS